MPLLIGTNREEWSAFVYLNGDTSKQSLDESGLVRSVEARIPGYADSIMRDYRTALRAAGCSPSPVELFIAIETDRFFRVPAVRMLEARERAGAPAFSYLFTWPSPMLGGVLRACHGLELPFVFGTAGTRAARVLAGVGRAAESLRDTIMTAWASFVHGDAPRAAGLPAWPEYRAAQRHTMCLASACSLERDPLSERRRAWARLL